MENWKPVAGFETEYEVSDLGRVRSIGRSVRNGANSMRKLPPQIIAPYFRKEGYATVKLAKHRAKLSCYIHRLVAEAFIGKGANGTEVCHRNGNKADNRAGNLYWGTRVENMADRTRLGEAACGIRHGHAKLSEADVFSIRGDPRKQADIAADFGVSRRLIGMIKAKTIWTHLTDMPSS